MIIFNNFNCILQSMSDNKKSTNMKKSTGIPLYGSRETPRPQSVAAPTNEGVVSGKPRPKPTTD